MRESRAGLCADIDARAGSRGELSVSGNEIGVQVSFKDVADGELIRLGSCQVNLHVALRVDHNGLAFGRQHVRSVR